MELIQSFFQNSGSFERTTMNPWRGTSNKSSINKGLLLVPPRATIKNERFLIVAQLIAPAALLGRRAGRALLAACVFVLASCTSPFWKEEEIPAGTVIVDIAGSLAAGRTIVADFASLANKLELTLTKGGVTIESKTIEKEGTNSLATTTTFTNLVPGNYAISIGVFKDSALLGSGSTFVTIGTGTGSAIPIPITYTKASTGSFSFTLELPSDVSADSLVCSWVGIPPSQAPSLLTSESNGIWTIAGSNITSGDWTLKIMFKDGDTALGFIHEVVQVRDNVKSNKWIDTGSALVPTRTVSIDELVSSSTSADITITGLVDNNGADYTYTSTLDNTWTVPTDLLTTSGIIGLALSPGILGQSISWKWDSIPMTNTTLGIEDGQNSHDLDVTVTAPNGETKSEYTIPVYKACRLRFNVLNLTNEPIDTPAMQVIKKGSTASNPLVSSPNDSSTLWSTKADFSESLDFNMSITEDTTLYAVVYPIEDILIPEGTYSSEIFTNLFTNNLGKTFHLLGDVNINDSWRTSLGDFTGTFRGYGHTITLNEGSSVSFFGKNTGTIQDLDIVIPAEKTATGDSIFVDINDWSGIISHCRVQGNISRIFANCGGFARINNGTLKACHASGELKIETSSNTRNQVGGLASQNPGTISFSSSTMKITVKAGREIEQIGGLVGLNNGSITHSYSNGTISITGYDANAIGGLVGSKSQNGALSDSFSSSAITVTVSGSTNTVDIGGLAGRVALAATGKIQIENCSALGSVTVTNNGSKNIERIGGFIGHIDASSQGCSAPLLITNCFARNSVSIDKKADSVGGFIGGITGDISSTGARTLEKCYAIGNINTGTTGINVGGFIGSMSGTYSPSISNCYARGTVTADNQVGGFVGYLAANTTISNCYASGEVTHKSEDWGGFVGESLGTISNCFFENKYNNPFEGNDESFTKSTAEMKLFDTFNNASWSISESLEPNTIWGIDTNGIINDGYPYLQCFGAATVTP